MRVLFLAALIGLAGAAAAQEPGERPSTPVVIGASPDYDACPTDAVVNDLDPSGDGFLAVRGGPGARNQELDRLYNGEQVSICIWRGDWLGIVYTKTGQDCNVSTPWPVSQAYTGPCRSGWVHRRWIKEVAG